MMMVEVGSPSGRTRSGGADVGPGLSYAAVTRRATPEHAGPVGTLLRAGFAWDSYGAILRRLERFYETRQDWLRPGLSEIQGQTRYGIGHLLC